MELLVWLITTYPIATGKPNVELKAAEVVCPTILPLQIIGSLPHKLALLSCKTNDNNLFLIPSFFCRIKASRPIKFLFQSIANPRPASNGVSSVDYSCPHARKAFSILIVLMAY